MWFYSFIITYIFGLIFLIVIFTVKVYFFLKKKFLTFYTL